MPQQIEAEIESSEQLLARYGRLTDAIAGGVTALTPLIGARLDAEKELRAAQVQEALTPGTEAQQAVLEAELAVRAANAALDGAAGRLAALRAAQAQLGGQLAEQHQALASELPGYLATLAAAFTQEWNEASNRFAPFLARRAALEQLLGRKLKLAEPTAGAELPSLALGPEGRPAQVLDSLKGCLAELKARNEMRTWRPSNPAGFQDKEFVRDGVYVLSKPWSELPSGTLVVSASFEDGRLHWLVEYEHAAAYQDGQEAAGLHAARAGVDAIAKREREEAERRRQEQQAELDARPSHKSKVPEVYHGGPEQTDTPLPVYVDKRGRRVSGPVY